MTCRDSLEGQLGREPGAGAAAYEKAWSLACREGPLIRTGFLGRSSPFPGSSRLIGFPGRSRQPSPEQPEPETPGRAGKVFGLSREQPLIRIGFPGRSSPFPGRSRLCGLASQGGAAPFQGGAASLAQSSRNRQGGAAPFQGAAAQPA